MDSCLPVICLNNIASHFFLNNIEFFIKLQLNKCFLFWEPLYVGLQQLCALYALFGSFTEYKDNMYSRVKI